MFLLNRTAGSIAAFYVLGFVVYLPASGAEPTVKQRPCTISQKHGIDAIAFSPDGQLLAVGGGWTDITQRSKADPVAELTVWNIKTGKNTATLTGHTKAVWCLAFSPDGKTLASGSADKTVRLWDVARGKEIVAMKDSPQGVSSLAFSPDGKSLAGAVWVSFDNGYPPDMTKPGTVLLWDVASRKVQTKLKVDVGAVDCLMFSPDGKTLVTATSKWDKEKQCCVSGELWFWDPATGKPTGTLKAHNCHLSTFAFSPDGKTLATGGDTWEDKPDGGGYGRVKLWDLATQKLLANTEVADGPISGLAFSPDGKILVATGGPIFEAGPYGSAGLLGTTNLRGEVALLDAKTLKKIAQPPRTEQYLRGAIFQPSNHAFATIAGDKVLLWEIPARP